MTAAEFRDALTAHGLSQRELSRRLGVAANTVNRWASGELDVPQYAIAYLSLLQTPSTGEPK